jgi:hypothetical protein
VGCPDWVDLLGLGRGKEKVGRNEEAAGRSTQYPGTPNLVAALSPTLGRVSGESPAVSSRDSSPAHLTLHA